MSRYRSGIFKPKNPQKYKGRVDQIVWRSTWEHQVMRWLDDHPDVISWASEERHFCIPYRNPIKSNMNNLSRYFPDFYVKKRGKDGKIEEMLIEVKPKKETKPPPVITGKRAQAKTNLYAQATYAVNEAKWAAADKYCKARGWQFIILTEDNINHLGNY